MSFPNLVATQTFQANIDGALPGRVLTCQSNGGSSTWADPVVPDPLTVNNLDVSTTTTLGGDLFITASLPANVGDLLTCTNSTTGAAEWAPPPPIPDPLTVNTATVNTSFNSTSSSVLGGALRITGGTPTTGQFLQCTSGTGAASWAAVTSPDPLTVNTATVNTSLTSTAASVLGGTLRITGGTPTTGQFLQCTNGGTGAASWAAVTSPDPLTVNTATVNTSLTSTTSSVLGGTLRITGGTPTTGQFLQCTNGGTGAASWAAVPASTVEDVWKYSAAADANALKTMYVNPAATGAVQSNWVFPLNHTSTEDTSVSLPIFLMDGSNGSLRLGHTTGTAYQVANRGTDSVGGGLNVVASGAQSTAFGLTNTASGAQSATVGGQSNTAASLNASVVGGSSNSITGGSDNSNIVGSVSCQIINTSRSGIVGCSSAVTRSAAAGTGTQNVSIACSGTELGLNPWSSNDVPANAAICGAATAGIGGANSVFMGGSTDSGIINLGSSKPFACALIGSRFASVLGSAVASTVLSCSGGAVSSGSAACTLMSHSSQAGGVSYVGVCTRCVLGASREGTISTSTESAGLGVCASTVSNSQGCATVACDQTVRLSIPTNGVVVTNSVASAAIASTHNNGDTGVGVSACTGSVMMATANGSMTTSSVNSVLLASDTSSLGSSSFSLLGGQTSTLSGSANALVFGRNMTVSAADNSAILGRNVTSSSRNHVFAFNGSPTDTYTVGASQTFNALAPGGVQFQTTGMHVDDTTPFGTPTAPAASALMDLTSTTRALLVTRTTRASIATPVNGMILYDSAVNEFYFRRNGAWQTPSAWT